MTLNQIPVIKTWAEDSSNVSTFNQTQIGAGIGLQADIFSNQINGFTKLLFQAVQYLQNTGGMYNSTIPYSFPAVVSVVTYNAGIYGISTFLRTTANPSSTTNNPPLTGATISTTNSISIYTGGTENTDWTLLSSGGSSGGGSESYMLTNNFPYSPQNYVSPLVIKEDGNIKEIRAFLLADSGIQWSSMYLTTGWTATTDGANLAATSTYYLVGDGALTVDKTGTTTSSCGMQKTTLVSQDLTSKKLRVSFKVPSISAGSLTGVRIWVGSGAGFTNYKYFDKTTDVAGRTITAGALGFYTVEIEPSATASGSGGSYNIAATDSVKIELLVSATSSTFSGLVLSHLVIVPGSSEINVNLFKRTSAGDLLIKQNADTYSFPSLRASSVDSRSTSLDNSTVSKNDIIYLNIPSCGEYGGYGLVVFVELE